MDPNLGDVLLSELSERDCLSPRKHGEHLLDVHQEGDAPDLHFRCPGREEDSE